MIFCKIFFSKGVYNVIEGDRTLVSIYPKIFPVNKQIKWPAIHKLPKLVQQQCMGCNLSH